MEGEQTRTIIRDEDPYTYTPIWFDLYRERLMSVWYHM